MRDSIKIPNGTNFLLQIEVSFTKLVRVLVTGCSWCASVTPHSGNTPAHFPSRICLWTSEMLAWVLVASVVFTFVTH